MKFQLTKITILITLSLFITHLNVHAQAKLPDGFTAITFANGIPSPDGLTFDSGGNLYVASERGGYEGKIFRIDTYGIVTTFATGLNRADGLVYEPLSGLIYVSEEVVPGRVSTVDTSGNVSVVVPESSVNNPEGLALNPLDGKLYIAEDRNPGRILIYDPASGDVSTFLSGLHRPEGITFDDLGNLYVAETATNQILKVTPGGSVTVLVPSSTGIIAPDNVLFNGTYGVLFVTEDASPGRILVVDPNTGLTTTLAKKLSYPQGMAFDTAGDLYVSEQGQGRIIRITGFKCCSAIINNGAQYTRKRWVTLRILYHRDVTDIRLSHNGTRWTRWQEISPQIQWRLKRGYGLKTVYIKCRKSGEVCEPATTSITRKRRKRK